MRCDITRTTNRSACQPTKRHETKATYLTPWHRKLFTKSTGNHILAEHERRIKENDRNEVPTRPWEQVAVACSISRQFQQFKYYNQHACDLHTLKVGDVVRMKPFQLGSKECKKGTMTSKLDERS